MLWKDEFRRSERGLDLRGMFSLAGDNAGETEMVCIEGVRVLVKVSCRLAERFDVWRVGIPGVVAGVVPLTIPFSFVTRPLSWAN